MGFRVCGSWGLGIGVTGFEFRVSGLGFRVWGSDFCFGQSGFGFRLGNLVWQGGLWSLVQGRRWLIV